MPADRTGVRFVSRSLHWLLIFGSLVLLGSGWYIRHAAPTESSRQFWLDSHISLGLSCAILVLLQILLWTIREPVAISDGIPHWRKRVADSVNILLYLSLAIVIISGYSQTVLSGRSISYWGIPLPEWDAASFISAPRLGDIHRVVAFVAGGLIVLHVAMSGTNRFGRRRSEIPAPGLPSNEEKPSRENEPSEAETLQLARQEKQDLAVAKTAKNLASNLRFLGWIEFWAQFILGLIIVLLLTFATSGSAFSPSKAGFGDAIYWAYVGFALLCPAVVLAYYYIRTSRRVVSSPTAYLLHDKKLAFWYLRAGLVLGQFGIFVSFVGVALSISLLVVKTISQPPGIAITDPNNIIRALDVFVLIANFMLLIAHFIGVVTALWLGFSAAKARVGYMAIRSHAE